MKKIFFLVNMFFLCSIFMLIFGCAELDSCNTSISANNICNVRGVVSSDFFRAAYPSSMKNNSSFTYSVKAYQDSEENSVSATMSGNNFQIALKYGTWNLKAEVYDNGKLVMFKVQEVEISGSEATVTFHGFELVSGEKNGAVSLNIAKNDDSNADTVVCQWNDPDGNSFSQTVAIPGTFNMTGDDFSFGTDGKIPTGSYNVSFYVKNSSGVTICFFMEKINVCPGMTTEIFTNSSSFIKDGKICISRECESISNKKIFYISLSAGKNGTGGKLAPLKNIQQAVDTIQSINDGTSSYQIVLMDSISADASEGINHSGLGKFFVDIDPDKQLNLLVKGEGSGVVISGCSASRGFYVGSNANVTFNNVEISGFDSSVNGNSLYCEGDCTFSGNTNISSIYLGENKKINLDNDFSRPAGAPLIEITYEEKSGSYISGNVILEGSSLETQKALFSVKNSSNGNSYFINDSGILEKGPEVVTALTKDGSGRYCIGNRKELEFVRDKINEGSNIDPLVPATSASYILTDDIDLVNVEWEGMGESGLSPFTGEFDGDNHRISNLRLKNMTNNGLFRFVKKCHIKNIKEIAGNFSLDRSCIGAIAGVCTGGNVVFENIVSNVNIETDNSDAAGLVGEINSTGTNLTIINCINKGNIKAKSNAGGFIGNVFSGNTVNIYNCANIGTIEVTVGTGGAGGFIGKVSSENLDIINCYNTGIIKGIVFDKTQNGETREKINAGGFFGCVSVNIQDDTNPKVKYSYYYNNCSGMIIGDDPTCGYHLNISKAPIALVSSDDNSLTPVLTISDTEYSQLLPALNCQYVHTLIVEKTSIAPKKWIQENTYYVFKD